MGLDLQGTWTFLYDTVLDGQVQPPPQGTQHTLQFDPLYNGQFIGHYTDISDPSVFVAQVFSSPRGTVISVVQTHPAANYFATYVGLLTNTAAGVIQGSYTDVAGFTGDFQYSH
jgi:hypothetical protein